MTITSIRQQERLKDRFSVYVDGAYAFSVSDRLLLESRLATGQELTGNDVKRYKQLSSEDKLYTNAVRYAAMRLRSRWEIGQYLQRKEAAPALAEQIIDRLAGLGLVNDEVFGRGWIENRRLLKPTSKRKLRAELQAKRLAIDIIDRLLRDDPTDDRHELRTLVEKKRRQPKYRDDEKLMQYLARQGFGYEDIKTVLHEASEEASEDA